MVARAGAVGEGRGRPTLIQMKDSAARFAAAANSTLAELGAEPPSGSFVCPICLQLRPQAKAAAAHYPAESMPGRHIRTLACEACNSLMGGTYEPEGVDWLRDIRTISWGFEKPRQLSARGTLEKAGKQVTMKMGGPLDRRRRRRRRGFPRTLMAIREQASDPNVAQIEIRRPKIDSVERTLLAWAFLTWSHYSRYAYTASPGAELVRRLILAPDTSLPAGLFVAYETLTVPLHPDPIVVFRSKVAQLTSYEGIEEFIGLGVEWGNGFSVLPFASDSEGECWRRTAELIALQPYPLFGRWPIREWMPDGSFRRQLRDEIAITGNGVRYSLTQRPLPDAAALLAQGQSSHRLEPRRGRWRPARALEHDFSVVAGPEFRLPRT